MRKKNLMNEQQGQSKLPTFIPMAQPGTRPIVGIVGHGFVGKAVESSFIENDGGLIKFIVDPKYGVSIDQLIEKNPHIVFVCAPTPMREGGRIDSTIVEDAVLKLIRLTKAGIVIKSTITPDVMDRLLRSINMQEDLHRIIYAPEFLQENTAYGDYVNPQYMVFGGMDFAIAELVRLFDSATTVRIPKNVYVMNPIEASFVKYGINTFLAAKVTFFNQFYDAMTETARGQCNPYTVLKAVSADPRIGDSHWRVPGHDGKRGFGGACFPKDLSAFINYTPCVSLLEEVKKINDKYRNEYELGEREQDNNVQFDAEDEESEQGTEHGSIVEEPIHEDSGVSID
jgi:UDPglucose 6-dehydrogenase